VPQILDVSNGLEYLHSERVVHGDLKGVLYISFKRRPDNLCSLLQLNILVTPSHRACIADFGLSSICDAISLRFTHSTATPHGGTGRYQAPELLSGARNHFGSDVYAFACVCYEARQSLPVAIDCRLIYDWDRYCLGRPHFPRSQMIWPLF
jgi:serine/threonine protein kinase